MDSKKLECDASGNANSIPMQGEFSQSTGPTSDDTTTCAPSRRKKLAKRVIFAFSEEVDLEILRAQGRLSGPAISLPAATPVRKTVELESTTERQRLLSALSSSALLASFARSLFSERIQLLHEGMLPGLGNASEIPLPDLATVCCPFESVPVALVLTTNGTGCSCSASVPTPSASGFGCKDVPKMLERRERCKEAHGNGNGFGLTLAQYLAVQHSPTPTASDWKGSTGKGSRRGTVAESVAMSDGVPGETVYPHPEYVEALMGFPIGFSDLDV